MRSGRTLRLAAEALLALVLAATAVRLVPRVLPQRALRVDLRLVLEGTPFARLAPAGPLLLDARDLAAARRGLIALALVTGGVLLWLGLRVWRLESKLADSRDSGRSRDAAYAALQDHHRELIETALEFRYRHDLRGGQLWLDERGRELLEYSESELEGLSLADLLAPDSLSAVQENLERALVAGRGSRIQEVLLFTRTDRPVWIETRDRLARCDGVPVAVEGLAREITDRKTAELRAAIHLGVAAALAEATSLERALRGALAVVTKRLGWKFGEIWWVDETYDVLRAVGAWAAGERDTAQAAESISKKTLGKGVGLPGRVWSLGELVVEDGLTDEDHALRIGGSREAPHFCQGLGVPIRALGRVLGVLVLLSSRSDRRRFAPFEILDSLGDQIGPFAERLHMEDELRAREARKIAMLESALDCIITVDDEGRILEFNPASERTFRIPRADALGKSVADLIVPEELRESHLKGFRAALDSGDLSLAGRRIEVEGQRADGSRFPIELSLSRIRMGSRPVFTAYLRDITERKEVERLKDELVSTVSHELRTPLASLRGFVELMLTREYPLDERRRFLGILDQEIKRLSRLIDDFLDVQKLEAGKLEYSFAGHDLNSLVDEALTVARASSQKHAFEASVFGEPLPVRVDRDRIRQALQNVLSNAVKYSPDGGTIHVRTGRSARTVWVSVRDEGIGMDPKTVERLFTKFFRADNTVTRRIGGTGLGLALVKEILVGHGGDVGVRSCAGEGSEFTLWLPLGKPGRKPAAQIE